MGSILGAKIPRNTLDDMVMETIGDDSTLRREGGSRMSKFLYPSLSMAARMSSGSGNTPGS